MGKNIYGVEREDEHFSSEYIFYSLTEKNLVLMQPLLDIPVRKLLGTMVTLTAEIWGSASILGTSVLAQLQLKICYKIKSKKKKKKQQQVLLITGC